MRRLAPLALASLLLGCSAMHVVKADGTTVDCLTIASGRCSYEDPDGTTATASSTHWAHDLWSWLGTAVAILPALL
ncbi:MAG TPA: hypothetical protein VES97_04145 [Solirubrobacteraceae bacterium]|nr:hypothetical protein [Solirubrobacteraceae bacterium]